MSMFFCSSYKKTNIQQQSYEIVYKVIVLFVGTGHTEEIPTPFTSSTTEIHI